MDFIGRVRQKSEREYGGSPGERFPKYRTPPHVLEVRRCEKGVHAAVLHRICKQLVYSRFVPSWAQKQGDSNVVRDRGDCVLRVLSYTIYRVSESKLGSNISEDRIRIQLIGEYFLGIESVRVIVWVIMASDFYLVVEAMATDISTTIPTRVVGVLFFDIVRLLGKPTDVVATIAEAGVFLDELGKVVQRRISCQVTHRRILRSARVAFRATGRYVPVAASRLPARRSPRGRQGVLRDT